MADLGDFGSVIREAVGDMPEKLKVASDGFKSIFGGFSDMVRKT